MCYNKKIGRIVITDTPYSCLYYFLFSTASACPPNGFSVNILSVTKSYFYSRVGKNIVCTVSETIRESVGI